MFPLLIAAGTAVNAQAQSIERMRELLQEIQQEVDSLEKEQARTLRLRERLQQPVESVEYVDDVIAVDTLPSGSDAVMIVLFNDNTWKYLRNRDYVKDSEVYTRCWDTTKLFPYRDSVALSDLPRSVDIQLVDSLRCYHYPYKANIRSKFGMRRRRKHQGVDLPLKTGDPVYATFNGKVRISFPSSKTGGYGNLIIIRHDNGLETFYGHRAASPFRDPLLRAVVRPGASDRLPKRQSAARDLPAQTELSGYPFECFTGFRGRGG